MSSFGEGGKRPIKTFGSYQAGQMTETAPAASAAPAVDGTAAMASQPSSVPVDFEANQAATLEMPQHPPRVEVVNDVPETPVNPTRIQLQNPCDSCFTCLEMSDTDISSFVREYTPELKLTGCVAEIPMLLSYMVKQERAFGVTLPFRACGVDTIVFDTSAVKQQDGPYTVEVPVTDGAGEHTAFYEKIVVDGIVFLSCVSESLDPDYLHRIISEAADALYIHGQYVYTMVGPRPLQGRTVDVKVEVPMAEEGTAPVPATQKCQEFIETLKLNSFELSVFVHYMRAINGVSITYGTYDNRQAILFQR